MRFIKGWLLAGAVTVSGVYADTLRIPDLLEGQYSLTTSLYRLSPQQTLVPGKGNNELFKLGSDGKLTFKTITPVKGAHDDFSIVVSDNGGKETTLSLRVMNDVIDLGQEGKLIAPVRLENRWIYHWDCSGDGTSENTGSLNRGADFVSFERLNTLLNHDVKGKPRKQGINALFRFGTLNGVKVALPITGTGKKDESSPNHSYMLEHSTHYTDLAAIWAQSGYAEPTGWQPNRYAAATPSGLGFSALNLNNGSVEEMIYYNAPYVALEVF